MGDFMYFVLQSISLQCARHRGLRILSEQMRKIFARTNRSLVTARFDEDVKFRCGLNEHMGSYIFWRGTYSRQILKVLEKNLIDGMTFIDIGANQGEFTLFAAKRLPHGRVIAFEPTTQMYSRLVQNVALNNFENVELINRALGETSGQYPVFLPSGKFQDGTFHSGLFSLYKTDQDSLYVETVHATTLDEYVQSTGLGAVSAIKIDVEGAELFILRGGTQTLRTFRPVLIVEIARGPCRAAGYDSQEILSSIESFGYRIELILPDGNTRPLDREILGSYENIVAFPLCE